MSSAPTPTPKFRRTWIALAVGTIALLLIFLASVLAEPYLIVIADSAPYAEPRSSVGGWANSNLWIGVTSVCCLALVVAGYIAKRLSPVHSRFAVVALFALVVLYVLFAQFPATKSQIRIALWSAALPASFVVGAWLASRSRNAA